MTEPANIVKLDEIDMDPKLRNQLKNTLAFMYAVRVMIQVTDEHDKKGTLSPLVTNLQT